MTVRSALLSFFALLMRILPQTTPTIQLLDGLIHHGKARWTAVYVNKRSLGVCFDARC